MRDSGSVRRRTPRMLMLRFAYLSSVRSLLSVAIPLQVLLPSLPAVPLGAIAFSGLPKT